MAIRLQRESPAAPAAVIDAIRANTREWRESVLPPEVRAAHAFQVSARIRPPRFWLYYERSLTSDGGDPLELRGEVEARPGGGSRITVRCGHTRGLFGLILLVGGLAFWIWAAGGSGAGVLFALLGVVLLVRAGYDAHVERRTHPEARYLVERFEQALAAAEQATPGERAV